MTFTWQLLRAGTISLDAGALFGIVPRAIWGRDVTTDSRHRITLSHNCLLLTAPDGGRILVEAGSGGKFDAKAREIYALGDRTVHDAVADVADPATVRHVIVTHLHFDHAGGLTRLAAPGERADWTSPDGGPGIVRTFGDAEVIVQAREWHDAVANRSVMTRTYLRENLAPLEPCLRLVDSPPPFPAGRVPDRDAAAPLPLAACRTDVLPGIEVFLVPGHTWGQQAVTFLDDRERRVVFVPDVLPTIRHVGAAFSMAYDVEPFTTMIVKRWLLAEAVANDWLLVLDHEPDTPCVRVRPDGRGWFTLIPA